MQKVTFQCAVNKSHIRKTSLPMAAPFHCGKPMVQIKDAPAVTSTPGVGSVVQPIAATPDHQASVMQNAGTGENKQQQAK